LAIATLARRNPKSNWRALSMSVFVDESSRALLK